MLSSIHPLGERARANRWALTVAAFTVGAIATASAVGAALGAVGSVVAGGLSSAVRLSALGAVVLVAGILDLVVDPPGPTRQVNEHWIGHFRGWVYGGAFGAQLGAGVATYVVTWGVYATFAAEFLLADPVAGAVVGAAFGAGRSLALLAAGWVDRPSRLTAFHRTMARLGAPLRRGAAVTAMVVGVAAVVGGIA